MKRKYIKKELYRSKVFRVLASANEEYYWDIFIQYSDLLKDFDIIYVDDESKDYGKYIKDFFNLGEGLISSCFHKDNLKVINNKVLQNNLSEKSSRIFTSFDLQLDTNVVSELDNMIRGKKYPKNHKNDLKSLTQKREVHSTVSIGPYLMENYYNNGLNLSETILDVYYNFLLSLNGNSCNSYAEAVRVSKQRTKQFKEFFENNYKDKLIFEINDRLYKRIYLNLLKMIILNKSRLSVQEKVYQMLKFQNDELCSYHAGELNIAVKFFEEKYKFEFFSKLQQPNEGKLIGIVKNMAWDLFHLRNLEVTISMMKYESADFVFPLLFSFDKKFNELRKSSGLRLFINDQKSYNFYPFYKEDNFNKYLSMNKISNVTNEKAKRRRIRKAPVVKLDKLIMKYEVEILKSYFDSKYEKI
ncbi:hypothetical protein RI065_03185 [Mycoplasmatota bacterium zrk1]